MVLIVNGPVARRLAINSGNNAFGQGHRPNATIGRAVRLIMMNVMNTRPGLLDRATLGNPGKYSFCFAEHEDDPPWEPLHVARGLRAEDSAVTDGGGWGGVTLAYNVRSPEEVDRAIDEARGAGARIGREPAETFWGGYSGVFVDPDGHPWEVAHNPGWTLNADGSVTI